jgi:hypothetical protein
MMIDSRKSRHQSHNERVFAAEVNKKIAKRIELRAIFVLRPHRDLAMNAQATQPSHCLSARTRAHTFTSARDAFRDSCIYNEEREIFAGA